MSESRQLIGLKTSTQWDSHKQNTHLQPPVLHYKPIVEIKGFTPITGIRDNGSYVTELQIRNDDIFHMEIPYISAYSILRGEQ